MEPSDTDEDRGSHDEDPRSNGEDQGSQAEEPRVGEPEEMPKECRDALRRISIYTTRPGRKVFVEQGNIDRWISTDEAVDVVD